MATSREYPWFCFLQLIRVLILAVGVALLTELVEFGSPTFLLIVSAAAGGLVAGRFVDSVHPIRKIVIGTVAIWLFVAFSITLGNYALDGIRVDPSYDFALDRVWDHLSLLLLVFSLSAFSTTCYWRYRHTPIIEAFALMSAIVWLMSGHRNYQLDAPKNASLIAFHLGVEPQHFLLGVGSGVIIFVGIYLYLSFRRPLFGQSNPVFNSGSRQNLLGAGIATFLFLCLALYAWVINARYAEELSRTSNGVGQKNEEGQSPLGFHSAVGKTKQPAALLRLEGDYQSNPWSPMLYLREGALSEFNGKELVISSPAFDTDVPRLAPGQQLDHPVGLDSKGRVSVTQSIYLLAKHKNLFALDLPQTIHAIRNPDPQRFQAAYQVISLAPATKITSLLYEPIGNANWDSSTWEHYLRTPGSLTKHRVDTSVEPTPDHPILDPNNEDLRYEVLARRLTDSFDTPVEKAKAIVDFLSTESIYTRQPGHQVTSGGDPVAPYLFAERKRGYCVHFAHAAVYMFRALGIPARIGTGYLTDLSYAKDGHVLLHMGDRHAWPEIYIAGQGWTVLDIQPAQAEGEQTIIPDEKLLDELMKKLDPAEELITPPPPLPNEKSTQEQILETVTSRRNLAGLLILFICIWSGLKLWLRFGYRITNHQDRKLRRAYRAIVTLAYDLGLNRQFGETRQEYARRLLSAGAIDSLELTTWNEQRMYSQQLLQADIKADINRSATRALSSSRSRFPFWRRALAFFSPASLTKWGRW